MKTVRWEADPSRTQNNSLVSPPPLPGKITNSPQHLNIASIFGTVMMFRKGFKKICIFIYLFIGRMGRGERCILLGRDLIVTSPQQKTGRDAGLLLNSARGGGCHGEKVKFPAAWIFRSGVRRKSLSFYESRITKMNQKYLCVKLCFSVSFSFSGVATCYLW